jgi:hypothetical protein
MSTGKRTMLRDADDSVLDGLLANGRSRFRASDAPDTLPASVQRAAGAEVFSDGGDGAAASGENPMPHPSHQPPFMALITLPTTVTPVSTPEIRAGVMLEVAAVMRQQGRRLPDGDALRTRLLRQAEDWCASARLEHPELAPLAPVAQQ